MNNNVIRVRCWIDKDGIKFFGPGRLQLLEHIMEEGSISKAAKKMGMSYKKAWEMIDDLNSRGRKPIVVLRKGGEKGGGAEVTDYGKELISRYKHIAIKIQAILDEEEDFIGFI